ncbi:MAG: polyphosphate polymerase domain-containing protein [Clostridia bacterium]|nr:polyphosphate polymerase domain-containing protein [Clostridia bacterium]
MTVVKNPIEVMKRTEIKYVLDPVQTRYIMQAIKGHMMPDEYGITQIASLYYDTEDKRLIANSIQKPPFKEKIRVRSYGLATENSPVFLELKRKAKGTVYKRRISTDISGVSQFFAGGSLLGSDGSFPDNRKYSESQITRELEYFRDYYQSLKPACLIIYDRLAYFEPDGDLRITLDFNPRYRDHDLNLYTSMEGESLLPNGYCIMEIKVQQAMPLWLCRILSAGKIYKTSFSKYGEAYKRMMAETKESANFTEAATEGAATKLGHAA